MKKVEKQLLKEAFESTIWMAIRYADGRHTYAPSDVREAVYKFKQVFPDWTPKPDVTIEPPAEDEIGGMSFRSDYLYDLVNGNTNT